MRDYLKQKIKDELKVLNLNKQESINSIDWEILSENIGRKSGLTDEEIEKLQLEVGLVLIGLIDINDFDSDISEQINIPESISQKIAIDVFNNIFEPISNKIIIQKNELFPENNNDHISSEINQNIYDIATKHKLPIDKIGIITELTNKFLNGEISSTQYENKLSIDTNLQTTEISEIIKEINEKIILPKREALKKSSTVPLPPYSMKKEMDVPLPPPSYKQESKEIKTIEPSKDIFDLDEHKGESDSYKEHGIEIIKEEKISSNPSDMIIKNKEDVLQSNINIFENKLFNKTITPGTTVDYSLPKTNTAIKETIPQPSSSPTNPHDPYHEAL